MELVQGGFVLAGLFAALLLGIPIAFAMSLVAIIAIVALLQPSQLSQITNIVVTQGTSGTLLVAPMFILMAEILVKGGIARDMYEAASKWFNWLPGGLAVTSVMASAGLASATGSSSATVATIGSMSVPEVVRLGYDKRLACGAVVAGGTLGILIPPSLAMIVYGILTETSIVSLFMAGIIPGIMTAILLSLFIVIRVLRRPSYAPKLEAVSWHERFTSLRGVGPVFFLAVIIISSMYSGAATPTEAAGVGVVGALLILVFLRRLKLEVVLTAAIDAARTSAMILFLVFGGMTFSFVVEYLNVPYVISNAIVQLSVDPWLVVIIINLLLLFLGAFFDPISVLVLTMPFLFPIVVNQGFDPVWFGILVTLNAEIGLITPPVGLNLFVLQGSVPGLEFSDIVLGSLPYISVLLIAMILVAIFPQLALMLV